MSVKGQGIAGRRQIGREVLRPWHGSRPQAKGFCPLEEEAESYAIANIYLDEVRLHREESLMLECRDSWSYCGVVRRCWG
jgi:hypothetical protein